MKSKPPRRGNRAAAPRQPSGAPHGPAQDKPQRAGVPVSLSRRQATGILVLALLVLVSFYPALLADFIWDDVIFTEAPQITSLSGLWNIWFSPGDIKNEGHYWPIVYTSFWLEHKLWGMAPFGYHLVNVLLHLANTLLLWLLMRRLAVPGAWAVAAVFAVHPLHVESVAWIIERKDLLSGLFYLSALLGWMRFADTRCRRYYLLSLALFVAALLSKSIVITLPVAILIIQWYRHGRVSVADLPWLAPFFVVAAGITLADLSFYQSRETLSLGYSPLDRLLIGARALWFYVGKLLWPTGLIVIYPLWDIRVQDPLAWVHVIAILLLAALLWFGRVRIGRGPFAGALFFTVTLSPVLGFIDYGYMQFSLVADRFQYLAGIGVIAVVVGAAAHVASRLSGPFKTGAQGVFIAVLVLLGTLTWQQSDIYHDEVALFSYVVANNPDARYVHANLARALMHADRLEDAVVAGRTVIEKIPTPPKKAYSAKTYSERAYSAYSAKAHTNLGLALFKLERYDEAEGYFRKAAEWNPRHLEAHQHLGETLRKQGRHVESLAAFQEVLKINSNMATAHVDVGIALFKLQRYQEAIESISTAQALAPDLTPNILHSLLGQILSRLGRYDEATRHFRLALQADPRDFDAMDHFARMRFEQGEYEEALDLCHNMIRLEPDSAMAHANLGVILFQLQRHEEARQAFERALALEPALQVARAGLEQLRARKNER